MRNTLVRYVGAVLGAAAGLAIVGLLHSALNGASYMVLLATVAVVAAAYGLGPALVATALAILGVDFLFLAPTGSFALMARTDAALLVVLGATAVVVASLAESLRRRLARAERERLEAAGIAAHFQRVSAAAEREVDALHALHALRRPRRAD